MVNLPAHTASPRRQRYGAPESKCCSTFVGNGAFCAGAVKGVESGNDFEYLGHKSRQRVSSGFSHRGYVLVLNRMPSNRLRSRWVGVFSAFSNYFGLDKSGSTLSRNAIPFQGSAS